VKTATFVRSGGRKTIDTGSVEEPEQRAEIKLPPGAGSEKTNCGFGSFLFTTDLKEFNRKKIMVIEESFFINC
jgi:hypothetical protein